MKLQLILNVFLVLNRESVIFIQVFFFDEEDLKCFIGAHEYLPIIFDDQHFCITSMSFHSLLMGIC